MKRKTIPESLRERIPLLKEEWMELYIKMGEDPDAPEWNAECGDRLTCDDLNFIRDYTEKLEKGRETSSNTPPHWLIQWAGEKRRTTPWFRQRITPGNLEESWDEIIPMRRSDMQKSIELIVPEDADLNRLVVNPTSGTTGHPIPAPNHPRAVGCYDPLIQYTLKKHGVNETYDSTRVAAIQVCSQEKTITYRTVHSFLGGAGFAKINLSDGNWKSPGNADRYINSMRPVFLSGDPFSFMEYMRKGISYRPKAILTTALSLSAALRIEMEKYFRCPVADMYSLNETGPVAYSCPADPSKFHVLPHDIFVEVLNPSGGHTPEGTAGEIAVSGGRNPYLPLLRYLTGDLASIHYGNCTCGEKTASLTGLTGRKMVLFRTPAGKIINSIDISGIIREYPVYFFQFTQRRDYTCTLNLSAGAALTLKAETEMKIKLEKLFNNETEIVTGRMPALNGRKNIPFISEI